MVRSLLLGVVLAFALGCGDGADPDDARYEEAKATLASAGPGAAVAELFARNDPVDATRAVHRLVLHLYWEKKDLARCLVVGRTGVGAATEAATAAPDRAREIRVLIQVISSRLASCTWPGRGHEGIRIRKADREVGLKAARHALKLAQELGLPDEQLARAFWLLGAHLMLEKEGAPFREAFAEARRLGDDIFRSYVHGTLAIALARAGDDPERARSLFDTALRDLEVTGGEEAERRADQLRTAWRVLVPDVDRPAAVTVKAGPVTLEIVPSRAAQHFAIVSQLARGLIPAGAFPLVDEERKRLDRFAGLLGRKPELGRFFFLREAPTAALFDAAGAGLLSPAEVTDLSEMFRSLRDRIDGGLRTRRLDGEAFAAALDRAKLEAVATRASKFTKVESLTVEVWPISAEPGKPRCRFEDGRVVVEVNRKSDPTEDLVYGVGRAFLAERGEDIRGKIPWEDYRSMFLEATAALIVSGDAAAERRNVTGPSLLAAMRMTMETDGWSLDYEAFDPLAAYLRETTGFLETRALPK